jgi:hypothetical protein
MSATHATANAAATATQHANADAGRTAKPSKRAPAMLMQPARLAALQPSRLSASRALMVRAIRERWAIDRLRWDIDANSRGTALYRITTPGGIFDFSLFSFEYRSEGRTGRIIGRAWDMMGALIEGPASEAEIEQSGRELPKLYQGRATPRTLIWCRANRSSRAFDHTVAALAAGRQPDLAEIAQVGYLMRNTGLDGNGTFGTRSFRALEPDHVLAAPLAAQMLCAYMMRVFAIDLVHHLARVRSPDAVEIDPRFQRYIGVGNGSALGLVLFVNNHPHLIDRWLDAREEAIVAAKSIRGEAALPALRRLRELVGRAITFRDQDRMEYEAFAPSDEIAAELRTVRDAIDTTLEDPRLGILEHPIALLCDRVEPAVHAETMETVLSLATELVPDVSDALGRTLAVDEEFTTRPGMPAADLRRLLHDEYGWAMTMDVDSPAARRHVWYKSENAEEPRRGPWEEVEWAYNLGLDLPRLVQDLDRALADTPSATSVARFLASAPRFRSIVARVQALAGHAYHSPHMNIMSDDFIPVHIVRLMNVAIHGIDKTRDFLGRNIRGVLFHGAPTPADLIAGADPDWFYPEEPVL